MQRIILSLSAGALLLASCSSHEQPPETRQNATFCISDSLLPVIHIDTVQSRPVDDELLLTGKVTFNEDGVLKVYPLSGGYVQEAKVELGDYVHKGQVLAVLHSVDIASFTRDLSTAESNLAITKRAFEAAQDMYNSGISSEKDLTMAKNEYHKAESELQRAAEVMNIYGASGSSSNYLVKAPISGFIVEKKINAGMLIRPDNNDNIFTVSDLKDVWILANVYESDIAKVHTGEPVTVATLAYPDKVYNGYIDKIFSVLDPATRSMKVRVRLDNPDYILRPEMFAVVKVIYSSGEHLPSLPSAAVIFDDNKNFVLAYTNNCDISPREISIVKDVNGTTFVGRGIAVGEQIIASRQLLLYNQLVN